jgi:hypothetical protein
MAGLRQPDGSGLTGVLTNGGKSRERAARINGMAAKSLLA